MRGRDGLEESNYELAESVVAVPFELSTFPAALLQASTCMKVSSSAVT
jgi:hypothetical protein